MTQLFKKFGTIALYVYIFLIVAFPTTFVAAKQIMSIALILCILFTFWKKGFNKVKIPRYLVTVFGLYIITGVFWILVGVLYNGFKAPLTRVNVYIVNPIIYFFLILYIFNKGEKERQHVMRAVEMSIIFIVLYNVIFFALLNVLPPSSVKFFPGIRYNFGGLALGFKKITAANLVTLAFFIPFYFVRMLSRFDRVSILIVGLGAFNAIISARTALMLEIVLMVPLLIALNMAIKMPIKRKQTTRLSQMIGGIAVLLFLFGEKFMMPILNKIYLSLFATSKVGVNDTGSLLRIEQINDLINTWTWKPMLGWGEGANSLNTIRSNVSGSYEMTYFALLMQRGIVGTALFVFNIWITVKRLFTGAKLTEETPKKELYLATLLGFSGILFANATNPTIQSFDGSFLFFFPVFVGVFISNKQLHSTETVTNDTEKNEDKVLPTQAEETPRATTLRSRLAEESIETPRATTLRSRLTEESIETPRTTTLRSRLAEESSETPRATTLRSRLAEESIETPRATTLRSRLAEESIETPRTATLRSMLAEETIETPSEIQAVKSRKSRYTKK